ncbi:MAG TPA: ATP-binding protein [Candidatus Eisenbacteria bacterium]
MTPEQELEHLRFLDELEAHLRQVSDARKALSAALRVTREHFGAAEGIIAIKRPGSHSVAPTIVWPRASRWDLGWLDGFIDTRKARIPTDTILAPVDRYGRAWGAIGLRRNEAPFPKGTWRWLHRASFLVSEALAHIDRDRMIDVRDRLDRKIMEQLRPKDLFYQILDGLRSLTGYDHSSTLLFREDDDAAFTIVAEQIAWTKGKSRRIGQRLTPDEGVEKILQRREVLGFDREGDTWRERRWQIVDGLAGMLDYNIAPGEEREAAMLVAPIVSKTGVFGLLKIASRHAGSFGRYEAELVERFRSQATIAILNSQRTEFLHARLVEAEKKHAMADLARGVAHDVNNALGSVVPIVQAMREEVTGGQIEPQVFAEDLKQIETSLLTCRRIFGGMLSFARSGHRTTGVADLGAAVNATLAIMRDGLERRGITLDVDMPKEVPLLAGGQSDVEQVLLNLVTNARDAMPQGGTLGIRAARQDGLVEVVVSDTGEGIPKELLARVQEPFFTTRSQGSGLGLSIVRSILWEMNGRMVLESEPGHGTSVRFYVPAAPTEVAR